MIENMNESTIPSFYSIIPANLRYDDRLSASEKIFFSEITALTTVYGYCFATNKYFTNLYNCDQRTIRRWLERLEELGYIKVEVIKDEKQTILERRIYLQTNEIGTDKNVRRGRDKNVLRGTDKNVLYNNIYYNNITHSQKDENSKIKYADKVYMYEHEYKQLIDDIGKIKADKCISELSLYKKSKGIEYEDDYATIIRWVVDRVNSKKEIKNEESKPKCKYTNYEQRKYSDEFWEQFYDIG